VGIDRLEAKSYTEGFERTWMVKNPHLKYFYNDYCNQLKKLVTEGFMFFLDDDDFLDSPTVIEDMIPHLEEDKAIICQYRRKGRPKPPNVQMTDKVIARGWIGLPCLWLHHSHKNLANVQGINDYDDWGYIKEVAGQIPPKFVKQVVVCTDRRSWGK
jgi:hypothetical protein